MTNTSQLWSRIYDMIESNKSTTKFINPILKDNPYYRSGVNDGLRVALALLPKPKIAFLGKQPPTRTKGGERK